MISYEAAVYNDECLELALAIIAVCKATSKIPDRRARVSIIGAAMLTAAQALDGNRMPEESGVIKRNGIVANMAAVARSKGEIA